MLGIPTRGLVVGALVVASGLVAGCGGSYSSPPATTSGGVAGSHTTVQASARFSTASVSGLGHVLVDGKGRTVYILTKNGKTNVPCSDASGCTAVWPDLPLKGSAAAAKAGSGLASSMLGTKELSDGETYPTYNGWLMYEYTGDSGPGQANGEGITSFGGTWYVLSPSGTPIKPGGNGGGGGGY
jgi:predicted lipoprotein with Yx(FWY)xxD motif